MHGPGVRRLHGCWCRSEPSQHVRELEPGDSFCTVSPQRGCPENTAADSPWTAGPWSMTHQSYLSKCPVSEQNQLLSAMRLFDFSPSVFWITVECLMKATSPSPVAKHLKKTCWIGHRCFKLFKRTVVVLSGARDWELFTT